MRKLRCAIGVLLLIGTVPAHAQSAQMNFFITSAGPGTGADLSGLAGADRHCTDLAREAGVTGFEWHAYLSAAKTESSPAVNARDRIGTGPWFNYAGVQIAKDLDDLHGENNNLTKGTILTEKGAPVNGRGDQPNMHDILTGSGLDGRIVSGDEDSTCSNWTSHAGEGSALVGHHDRQGGGQNPTSWNSAHGSRGCGQSNLQGTGGNGFFYCFGIN